MSNKKDKNLFLTEAEKIIKSISKNISIGQKPKVAHIAYELYVYFLIIETLTYLPSCKIQFMNLKQGSFRPRYAPGKPNTAKYSYVKYEYKGELYEIQLDTLHKGISGVCHEMDVSIKNANSKFINAAFECKYTMSVMRFSYTREFIGMLTDFHETQTSKKYYPPEYRIDFIVSSALMPMTHTVHSNSQKFLKSKKRRYNPKKLSCANFQNALVP